MATEGEVLGAVEAGDVARLRALLDEDPSLAAARSDDGVSLLRMARYTMRGELVAAVLAADPELDVHDAAAIGETGRLRALAEDDPQLVHALAGDGFAPLHLAAFFGRAEAVRTLLEHGADPNVRAANPMRVTPLHSAAAEGDRESVALLLEAGANPNARQRGGFAPLHAAAASGDSRLARLLLDNGADAAVESDDRRKPADVARERGHAELAELLAR
jgi:ankyrin repeat protein